MIELFKDGYKDTFKKDALLTDNDVISFMQTITRCFCANKEGTWTLEDGKTNMQIIINQINEASSYTEV